MNHDKHEEELERLRALLREARNLGPGYVEGIRGLVRNRILALGQLIAKFELHESEHRAKSPKSVPGASNDIFLSLHGYGARDVDAFRARQRDWLRFLKSI